ncbi:unnamed protein product [Bursaphelenchus okinawaensis]|uniref:C3H1-type domain-containing protein n=1 Tax=Bursaphelenchus okinawaensis TaxID=465554 RepID=A0A811JUH3_9BILA|nr:unnamed protein product [Bursaphelenchus okinawaensis]CAG9084508.1 unnamed protein product [Bursaphelenchus okinawaensis]
MVKDDEQNGQEEDRKDVCRDFLNKVCNRGTRCKYYHPRGDDEDRNGDDFQFCIDYQNQGCYRASCRFVHAPQEEIERYRLNGDISNLLARAIAAVTKADNIQGIPFCKEFQTNRCSRGPRCRYWHVNVDMEREFRNNQPLGASAREYRHPLPQPLIPPAAAARRRPAMDEYAGAAKRPAFMPPTPYAAHDLERENADLKAQVERLQLDLQRERDRCDALLATISQSTAAAAQAAVVSPQQSYHDPYAMPTRAAHYAQKQAGWYGSQN